MKKSVFPFYAYARDENGHIKSTMAMGFVYDGEGNPTAFGRGMAVVNPNERNSISKAEGRAHAERRLNCFDGKIFALTGADHFQGKKLVGFNEKSHVIEISTHVSPKIDVVSKLIDGSLSSGGFFASKKLIDSLVEAAAEEINTAFGIEEPCPCEQQGDCACASCEEVLDTVAECDLNPPRTADDEIDSCGCVCTPGDDD